MRKNDIVREIEHDISIDKLIHDNFEKFLDIAKNSILIKGECPKSLDLSEVKKMLVLDGFTTISKLENFGLVAIPNSNPYGVTPYTDKYVNVTYANPIYGSGKLEIDNDCIIIKNTDSWRDLFDMINKYAIIQADIDLSLDIAVVNTRLTTVFTAENDMQKRSIEELYKNIRVGKFNIIEGNDLISKVGTLAMNTQTEHASITELITAKSNTTRQFLAELGISMSKDKTQAILSDETDSNEPSLESTIDTMLNSWNDGLKKVNEKYGTNLYAIINPKYRMEEREEEKDVDTDVRSEESTIEK